MAGRPNAFRDAAGRYARQINAVETLSVKEMADWASLDLGRTGVRSVAAAGTAVCEALLAELRALVEDLGPGGVDEPPIYDPPSFGLSDVHQLLAEDAQRAVIAAYKEARQASPRSGVAPYRVGSRYADGALLSALRSGAFAYGDRSGITFGNVALLNASAKQWKRLNFGAGAAGNSGLSHAANVGSGPFSAVFHDLEVAAIGLGGGVRPAFFLPKGFWKPGPGWSQSGTRGAFIPHNNRTQGGGNPAIYPTKGIRAEHWLDAGLAAIANGIGAAYIDYFGSLFDHASSQARSRLPTLLNGSGGVDVHVTLT